MSTTQLKSGIAQAVAAAGSQAKLADLLGCTQQNVSHWVRQGFVPVERIREIEQVTGIHRSILIDPALIDLLAPADL